MIKPEQLEKGLKLSTEIHNLATKAVEFVKEEGGNMTSLLVLMAAGEMSKELYDLMMESVRKDIKEKPELLDKLRKEHGSEENFGKFVKELEKPEAAADPAADVDFKPIGEE